MEECCSLALVFEVEMNEGNYYSDIYHMHSMDNISQFNPPMANMINGTVCLQRGIDVISAELKSEYCNMQTYSEDHIADNQDLMVGIAWVLKSERRKFRIHGTVLHIDAVGDTNEEDGCSLLCSQLCWVSLSCN